MVNTFLCLSGAPAAPPAVLPACPACLTCPALPAAPKAKRKTNLKEGSAPARPPQRGRRQQAEEQPQQTDTNQRRGQTKPQACGQQERGRGTGGRQARNVLSVQAEGKGAALCVVTSTAGRGVALANTYLHSN